jgi:tryptophan-rich sensory protein
MLRRILAFFAVLISTYLPLAILWNTIGSASKRYYLLLMPGWLPSLCAIGQKEVQIWVASIATLGIVVGLTWLGSKGRRQLVVAAAITFVNSAVIAAFTYIVLGAIAASGGAG